MDKHNVYTLMALGFVVEYFDGTIEILNDEEWYKLLLLMKLYYMPIYLQMKKDINCLYWLTVLF